MAEYDVASLLKGIADALGYLAQELIVHRDVNPDNMLLTSTGQLVRARVFSVCMAEMYFDCSETVELLIRHPLILHSIYGLWPVRRI